MMKITMKFRVLTTIMFSVSVFSSLLAQGVSFTNNEPLTHQKTTTDNLELIIPKNSAVATHGNLQTLGNKILDKNRKPAQLRGVSLFWSQWMPQFYNKEAVAWLKEDWNINIIRASMGVEDNGGYISFPEREKQKVFTVIDEAIKQGIYVIVDWHSHHAEEHLEEAKAFFGEVSKKYGHQPNIIYEIYNEPLNEANWVNVLKPYHEAVIAAIRKNDKDNLVVCGTRTWSQNVDEVIGHEIKDNNVAYTLHYYAASHKESLRNKAQKALNAGLPLFVTEFGTTIYDGDGLVDVKESKLWWDFLDKNHISWCNWSICDKNESSAILVPGVSGKGGWTNSEITKSGQLVKNELKKNKQFSKKGKKDKKQKKEKRQKKLKKEKE